MACDSYSDDPSVFGEEAHIVAQGERGPRAGAIADVDAYDNLILLCRKDHKRVDDQVGSFTISQLRDIKRRHEKWVRSLGDQEYAGQVAERRRRVRELRQERAELLASSVAKEGSAQEKAPLLARGANSRVLELDLARGLYRMTWTAQGGRGTFRVDHETGSKRHIVWADLRDVSAGEEILRIEQGGRHVFSVQTLEQLPLSHPPSRPAGHADSPAQALAWQEGQQMSQAEAIAEALSEPPANATV